MATVKVIEIQTGEVVQQHTKCSDRRAEKIKAGLDINLNHDEYKAVIAYA